jgi:selenide,water dikinase
MTALNAEASRLALSAGERCAADVTGFGPAGHPYKLARASGVSAVLCHSAVPPIDGARDAARKGYAPCVEVSPGG